MKKIIVKENDFDALEVIRNHRIAPYMGMSQLAFQAMVIQERKVAQQIAAMIQRGRLPELLHLLIGFDVFTEEDKDRLSDTFKVCQKVLKLLKEEFHVQIIASMLLCSAGYESHYEWQFDEKFARALYSKEVREEFWNTKYLLPLVVVQSLLADLMSGVDVDNPTEADLRKSELVKYALSTYKKGDPERNLEEFIRFCM